MERHLAETKIRKQERLIMHEFAPEALFQSLGGVYLSWKYIIIMTESGWAGDRWSSARVKESRHAFLERAYREELFRL